MYSSDNEKTSPSSDKPGKFGLTLEGHQQHRENLEQPAPIGGNTIPKTSKSKSKSSLNQNMKKNIVVPYLAWYVTFWRTRAWKKRDKMGKKMKREDKQESEIRWCLGREKVNGKNESFFGSGVLCLMLSVTHTISSSFPSLSLSAFLFLCTLFFLSVNNNISFVFNSQFFVQHYHQDIPRKPWPSHWPFGHVVFLYYFLPNSILLLSEKLSPKYPFVLIFF